MSTRRAFITLLCGAAAWPLAAPGAAACRSSMQTVRGFAQGLKDAGYVEGENFSIESAGPTTYSLLLCKAR